jgi:hypothetical protein
MTYKASSTFYRLGYSITWNIVNSPLHFSRSVRLNIVLNTFLKGMLKYFRIKLVKWIGNMEGNYFKLSLIIFDKSYPKYYKFRGRLKSLKFSSWNYLYFKKTSWVLGQLKDYYTKKHYKPKFKLGSGNYWHKFYKSIYFILNKNFKHSRKTFKNGTIDAEFLCEPRSDNSGIVKLNNLLYFNVNKFSKLPHYQFMFKFYFKLYLYLKKWKFDYSLSFYEKKFKFFFLLKLLVLNFFLKKSLRVIKNKPLRRFHSKFINSAKTRYTLTKRILSHKTYFFNYLHYVKGSNYQWRGSGRVIKNFKSFSKQYNSTVVPWAATFLKGYFFNMSYKKIVRRYIIGMARVENFLERMRLSNFLVKNYVVWNKNKSKNRFSGMSKRNMFFNNNFVSKAVRRLKFFYKKFNFGSISYKLKLKKFIARSTLKNKLYNFTNKSLVMSNQYFFSEKEDGYMTKYGFLKTKLKLSVLYYLRRKYKKSVLGGVLRRKKDLIYFNKESSKINLFKNLATKLKLLNLATLSLSLNASNVSLDEFILKDRTFSSFQKKKPLRLINNPFNSFLNNFLFFIVFPKYSFLTIKKKKKKVNVGTSFSFSDSSSNFIKNSKLLIFLKIYSKLLAVQYILKKKIFIYKNEINIFLFKSFWSLEFFQLYFRFKFYRLNFEKLFKKSKNNLFSKKIITQKYCANSWDKIRSKKKYKFFSPVFRYFKTTKLLSPFIDQKLSLNFFLSKTIVNNKRSMKYFFFHYCYIRLRNFNKKKNIKALSFKSDHFNFLWKNSKQNKQMALNWRIPGYFIKRLKIKQKFFGYKIKTWYKKKDQIVNLNISRFYKNRDFYLKIWKKQIKTYFYSKNKKLLLHRKFKYNYNTLVKNIESAIFFSNKLRYNVLFLDKVLVLAHLLNEPDMYKKRMVLKFTFYKKMLVFNYVYALFRFFLGFSSSFSKMLLIFGFNMFRKDLSLYKLIKFLIFFFKKTKSKIFHFKPIKKNNFFINYKKKMAKKIYCRIKETLKKAVRYHSLTVFKESLRRYSKTQFANYKSTIFTLNKKYDDLKDYKLRGRTYYNRFKILNLPKNAPTFKKKKNFKAKSRNKFLGRVNYRKYKIFQRREMLEETLKKRQINYVRKKKKRSYMYFMIQKNSSKGILKQQPKTIFRSLYDAGSWFKYSKNKIRLSQIGQKRALFSLYNFNKYTMSYFKKKTYQTYNTMSKDEIHNFLLYLNTFKKNKLSSLAWRISKKFYFSRFYLSRVKTFYYTKLFYKKRTMELNRRFVIHFPLNGKQYSTQHQYQYRYLKHLERTALTTNRIFSKHRKNWVKDFFSYKDHLKIFKLIHLKLYHNIKFIQKKKLKHFKNRLNVFFNKTKLGVHKNLLVVNKNNNLIKNEQKCVLNAFKNLNHQLKNFIILSNKTKKLQYFLQHFVQFNYIDDRRSFSLKNVLFFKMFSSSYRIYNTSVKNFNHKNLLKNKHLNKFFVSWLKIFIMNFSNFKNHNNFLSYIEDFKNFKNLSGQSSLAHKTRQNKSQNILYFAKFLKYFNNKLDFKTYFELYNKNYLVDYDKLKDLITFFQSFIFLFFINVKNTKKLLTVKFNLKKIYKMKLLFLISKFKNFYSFNFNNNNFCYKFFPNSILKAYLNFYFFVNFLIFKIHRLKNNNYFKKNMYTTKSWIKNKKFNFWLEQQFEKSFKMNIKLNYISATRSISKFYRSGFNFYFLFTKRMHTYRFFQGWRQQSIYSDILWIILISIKYYSSSFFSNMLAEQIVKRKKQWPFIKIIRTIVREILPLNLTRNSIKVDGLRIGINGKINGRDRAINYLIYKYYKDKQISKIHQIYLKVDYSLSFANSKYGVFGIRVWISRL